MFYIYHIPGVKIGCTNDLKRRMHQQGYTNYEILETHEDGWIAGDREIELQKEYGYRVDAIHYMISVQNMSKATEASNKPEVLKKISDALKGRTFEPETIEKMRIAQSGEKSHWFNKNHSEETKLKMSIIQKNRKKVIKTCPYCNKSGEQRNMTRYHFNNCKNIL